VQIDATTFLLLFGVVNFNVENDPLLMNNNNNNMNYHAKSQGQLGQVSKRMPHLEHISNSEVAPQYDRHVDFSSHLNGGEKHDPETALAIENTRDDMSGYDVRKEDHFGEVTVIENAKDLTTHVLHVDDDPTASPWTFRAFLIGT
jgi:hypothetical protein